MPKTITADQYNDLIAKQSKRRKYNNQPIEVDGRRFDSIAEGTRYWELKRLEDAGEITNLECQVPYPLTVQGVVIGEYVADFRYRDAAGALVVEDTKGVRTAIYKRSKKHMKAQYGITIKET